MQLLAIGDLHLGKDQWQPEIPSTWDSYDGIFLVGDVADRAAISDAVIREFYESIGELEPPAVSIPGNHDFQTHAETITNIEGIVDAHTARIEIGEATVGGLGSTRFDEGPEVRGRLLNEHPPSLTLVDRLADAAEQGIADNSLGFSKDAIKWYQERFTKLRELLLSAVDQPRVLLTHVPPYGTQGAKFDTHPHYRDSVSWGSLAVRRYIEKETPDIHICGHIHDRAGQDTIGETTTLNAGYRQAFAVDVSASGVNSVNPISIEEGSNTV